MVWPVRFGRRVRDGLLPPLGLAALGLAAVFAFYQPPERSVHLRMTAGQEVGTRHRIARVLKREAAQRLIAIDLQPTAGSAEALLAVESGRVDAAFVQGGLDMFDRPDLQQAAALPRGVYPSGRRGRTPGSAALSRGGLRSTSRSYCSYRTN